MKDINLEDIVCNLYNYRSFVSVDE